MGIEEVQVQLIVAVRKSKCFSADICFKKPSGIFSKALFCRNEIDVAIVVHLPAQQCYLQRY